MAYKKSHLLSLLIGVCIILVLGYLSLPFLTKKQVVPISPSSTPSSAWKTYTNLRYDYAIQYPTNWFVDTTYSEDSFTHRGPGGLDVMGGDTTWSNYPNTGQYNPSTQPKDLAGVYVIVYQSKPNVTLDQFIQTNHFDYQQKQVLSVNGVTGEELIGTSLQSSEQFPQSKNVLLKVGENVFVFNNGAANTNISSPIFDHMIQSFQTGVVESDIQAALEQLNPLIKQYPGTLTIVGTSGTFVRFTFTPKPGVQEDPAFGFAQFQNGAWKILTFGTGGDPTAFYKQYNIPQELRDKGF